MNGLTFMCTMILFFGLGCGKEGRQVHQDPFSSNGQESLCGENFGARKSAGSSREYVFYPDPNARVNFLRMDGTEGTSQAHLLFFPQTVSDPSEDKPYPIEGAPDTLRFQSQDVFYSSGDENLDTVVYFVWGDYDNDGHVNHYDFFFFADKYGLTADHPEYEARFDHGGSTENLPLGVTGKGNGVTDWIDFLVFADVFNSRYPYINAVGKAALVEAFSHDPEYYYNCRGGMSEQQFNDAWHHMRKKVQQFAPSSKVVIPIDSGQLFHVTSPDNVFATLDTLIFGGFPLQNSGLPVRELDFSLNYKPTVREDVSWPIELNIGRREAILASDIINSDDHLIFEMVQVADDELLVELAQDTIFVSTDVIGDYQFDLRATDTAGQSVEGHVELRFIDSRPVVRVRVDRYDWVPAEGRKMTFRMDFSAEAGAEFIGGVADNQDTSIEGEFGLYQGDERSAYTYVSLNIPASQDTLVWIFTGTVVDSLGQEGFASVEFPQYGAGCDNTPARCGQTNACGVYGGDCPCDNTPPSCGQTNACGVYGGDCPPANLQNISFSPSSITTISVGQSTTFSVSGNNIAHYEWDLDGSRVGSSSSYTYTPGAGDSGPHTVVGRVYNSSRSSTDDNTWNFGVITGGAP